MCGICGIYNLSKNKIIEIDTLQSMVVSIKHRGPDDFGIYKDSNIGLGHARLSILDINGGQQPIHNEDKTIWIVYNGEIFNYPEIKDELIKKGHSFYSKTDTEVIVHLYEEKGEKLFEDLNGQFSFAIWDLKKKQLILARDRMGIRPLFYTIVDGSLIFGSEIKSIFNNNCVKAEIDYCGLDQLFTFWATIPPQTIFKNILELPPASYIVAKNGNIQIKKYWDIKFHQKIDIEEIDEDYYSHELFELLKDAAKIRLRADVPVASYLSGGLDSSFISALVKKFFINDLKTFSVSFSDNDYDESSYQKKMADFLGTDHKEIRCFYADIGKIMPEVIWHTEKPLIRTAPAPMFLLSKLVRQNNIKVVLTGEGADEILGGYDLFKEMKIRRFWAKYPNSKIRPLLFKRLYQNIQNWPRNAPSFISSFYRQGIEKTNTKYFSHIPRWDTTANVKLFYSDQAKDALKNYNCREEFEKTFPDDFVKWDYLSQSQYIEMATILSGNLLSSQGDRMAMANSVEGRYPFLDYRVIEFCIKLPEKLKLRVMNEKYLLKKIAKPFLPESISNRVKQAYRAPDSASFFNGGHLEYVDELLSTENIKQSGYFNASAVEGLVKKCKNTDVSLLNNKYNFSITSIITTLLVDKLFIRNFKKENTITNKIRVINNE